MARQWNQAELAGANLPEAEHHPGAGLPTPALGRYAGFPAGIRDAKPAVAAHENGAEPVAGRAVTSGDNEFATAPSNLRERLVEVCREAWQFGIEQTQDPHSHAAAAIVGGDGRCLVLATNRLVHGVRSEAWRWNRPQRYLYVELAPRAAIFEAARRGLRIDGAWIVTTTFPAAEDARAIISTGIRGVATPAPDLSDVLESEYYVAAQRMLYESAVLVEYMQLSAVVPR
ncbi:MAG: hypothetical protein JSR54_03790 [Proteobacteria bacterium]|nr:hypothetical protein [Pseudomonadota bacterium]